MTTLREAAQQFVTDYENGDLGDLKHYARALRAALEVDDAAAELRRLHALNGELLEALHNISLASQDSGSTRGGMGRDARAAIARAEGKV